MSKTRMIKAVRSLDLPAAKELLRKDPALASVQDRSGHGLILLACSVACPDLGAPHSAASRMVRLLLSYGLDIDSTLLLDDYPCNSVWFAVAKGRNASLVRFLLANGATARGLFAAGWHQDMPILRLLVRTRLDVDEVAEGETPFLHCWKTKRFESARFLLRSGADIDFQDFKGKAALHYAIEKSFDPNRLRFLIQNGASADIKDRKGISARKMASRKRDPVFLAALG